MVSFGEEDEVTGAVWEDAQSPSDTTAHNIRAAAERSNTDGFLLSDISDDYLSAFADGWRARGEAMLRADWPESERPSDIEPGNTYHGPVVSSGTKVLMGDRIEFTDNGQRFSMRLPLVEVMEWVGKREATAAMIAKALNAHLGLPKVVPTAPKAEPSHD